MLRYARMHDDSYGHWRPSSPHPKPSDYYGRPLRTGQEQFSGHHHNISHHWRPDFCPPAELQHGEKSYAAPPSHQESRLCSTSDGRGNQHPNTSQPHLSDYFSGAHPAGWQQGTHCYTHTSQLEGVPGRQLSDYFDRVQHSPQKYNNPAPANQNNDFSFGRVYNSDEPKSAERCLDAACSCENSHSQLRLPPTTPRKAGNPESYPARSLAPALDLPPLRKISDRCFDVSYSSSNRYYKDSHQKERNPEHYHTPSPTPPLDQPSLSQNMFEDSRQLPSNIGQTQRWQCAKPRWENTTQTQLRYKYGGWCTEQIDDGQRAGTIKEAGLARRRAAKRERFERSRSRERARLPESWRPASPELTISGRSRSRSPERGEQSVSWELPSSKRRGLPAVRADVENEWALKVKERWPEKKRNMFDLHEISLQVMERALCGQAAEVVERGHYRTGAEVIVID